MYEGATESPLLIVANRLPVAWDEETGEWKTSPGGLVSALHPVLKRRSGTWVGWNGTTTGSSEPFVVDGVRQIPVSLSAEEVEDYYEGFCNGTIWPLYHDAIRPVEMHRHWWRPYEKVNRRFADRVADVARPGEAIWVHDYQLQLCPQYVRRRLPDSRIGFFLHIPFPPVEIFGRLPWRSEIVRGLLGADTIAFHTRQYMINFARAARLYGGAGGPAEALSVDGRTVRLENDPISIDFDEIESLADDDDVVSMAGELRMQLGDPQWVILGVDRLDYTKGIDLRLRALETLLARRPDMAGRVTMVQVAVPSREAVEEYQVIRERIEQMVGRINGDFGRPDWVPVHYHYRSLDRPELIAHYRAADVLLVTPLRDGMNLVAKEYVASKIDGTGALVLSEFAGAAEQLGDAFIVNPYDVDRLSEVLEHAIEGPAGELRRRMSALRRTVRRWDVHTWAAHCLAALES